MGGEHGDGGDYRCVHLVATRHRELHVPVAGGGDDAPFLESGEGAPRAVPLRLDLHLLVADVDPERDVLGPEVVDRLLGGDGPDLDLSHERSL